MAGPSDLYDACAEWLAACEAAVATSPGGPIGYAFVSPGPPVLDCGPQLSVHAGGPVEADTLPLIPPLSTGHRDTVQGAVHLVMLTCVVVRCVPGLTNDGTPPPTLSLETAARATHADLWAIWMTTRSRHRAGTLFAGAHTRELFLDPAFTLPTAGGFAGWQIPVRVQLDGYKAA